jgi:uridine kinase
MPLRTHGLENTGGADDAAVDRARAAPRLAWVDAPRLLREWAARRASVGSPGSSGHATVVIGITGPVGAGKSTLAARLGGVVLSTDNYLPDYAIVPEHERDDPRHSDGDTLRRNIAELRDGRATRVPQWSFQSHRREGWREVAPDAGLVPIVVVEGIHALADHAMPLLDIAVFVEAPRGVRWKRWEVLESTGQRGWGVERARVFFDGVAEPTFEKHEARYRAIAHAIVENGDGGDG